LTKPNVIHIGQGCTRERKRHGGIVMDIRGKNENDTIMVAGERNVTPNGILDILLQDGTLGKGNAAIRRFDISCWFRQLYQKTHNASVTSSWSDSPGGGRQMSEAKLWNLEVMKATMTFLRNSSSFVVAVCVEDARPQDGGIRRLRDALDRLAKHRELAGGRDKEITERVAAEYGAS
tara:strand:+ start:285 stop:815 length:531 start_codon:yes stop_codon:yes gene_type:complete